MRRSDTDTLQTYALDVGESQYINYHFPSPLLLLPAGHVFICIHVYFPGARCGIVNTLTLGRGCFYFSAKEQDSTSKQNTSISGARDLVRSKTCFSASPSCRHKSHYKMRASFPEVTLYVVRYKYIINIYSRGRGREVKSKYIHTHMLYRVIHQVRSSSPFSCDNEFINILILEFSSIYGPLFRFLYQLKSVLW